MKRFTGIFSREISNIHHAAFWLAAFGVLADILGLFRDRLLAGIFGASRALDIYYSAFRVPDLIYTFMLLFTASTAIIPFLLDRTEEKRDEFLGALSVWFLFAIILLDAIAFFAMPWLMRLSLPGFSEKDLAESIMLSRILLLSPLLLGISNIFSSITQYLNRFIVYGLSGVFYNLGIIVGIGIFYPMWGMKGLVLGVVFGAFLHMAIQIPSLVGVSFRFRWEKFWSGDIWKLSLLSLPRTLGLQINQVIFTILTGAASVLASGSISIINLASNLQGIPITIIGLSYSVAAFPSLASFSIKKAKDNFAEHFQAAFRHILFWALPFSVLLLILRAQIVRVILGSGAFTWSDTRLTAAALFILSISVVFQSLFYLLVRAFYADGESWRPLIINIISGLFCLASAFWFLGVLAHDGTAPFAIKRVLDLSDINDIRVLAVPLGMFFGSLVNFILLSFSFWIIFGWFPAKGSLKNILEIVSASLVGGAIAFFGLRIFAVIFDLHTFFGIFMQGLLAGIFGILADVGVLWILKNRELTEIFASIKSSIKEPKDIAHQVAAPEPEKLP